jgi:hypothetical protein
LQHPRQGDDLFLGAAVAAGLQLLNVRLIEIGASLTKALADFVGGRLPETCDRASCSHDVDAYNVPRTPGVIVALDEVVVVPIFVGISLFLFHGSAGISRIGGLYHAAMRMARHASLLARKIDGFKPSP